MQNNFLYLFINIKWLVWIVLNVETSRKQANSIFMTSNLPHETSGLERNSNNNNYYYSLSIRQAGQNLCINPETSKFVLRAHKHCYGMKAQTDNAEHINDNRFTVIVFMGREFKRQG